MSAASSAAPPGEPLARIAAVPAAPAPLPGKALIRSRFPLLSFPPRRLPLRAPLSFRERFALIFK